MIHIVLTSCILQITLEISIPSNDHLCCLIAVQCLRASKWRGFSYSLHKSVRVMSSTSFSRRTRTTSGDSMRSLHFSSLFPVQKSYCNLGHFPGKVRQKSIYVICNSSLDPFSQLERIT